MKVFLTFFVVLAAGIGAFAYFAPDQAKATWQYALGTVGMGKPAAKAADSADGSSGSGSAGQSGSGRRGGGSAVTVLVADAKQADFPVRRYAVGFLSSPAVVEISARISSQVVAIQAKDGQIVKTGDPLFSLDDRSLKAQLDKDTATLRKDQAMLVSAQSDLKRAKDLLAKQAGTQQTLDSTTAAQLSAVATITSDQAAIEADNIQLSYATIKSPIDGRLGAVQVAIGDLVGNNNSTSSPLVTVTQMTPLDATFNLPESDLGLARQVLSEAMANNVSIRINGSDQEIAKGTLYFVDSTVDVGSGTVQAKATIPNQDFKLWPGQYVNVQLDAGNMPKMVSIPSVAVQAGQKGPFVYLIKDGKSVEVRPIKVALTVGENSAISDGLANGDQVVTDGQAQLKSGAAIKIGKSQDAAPAKANLSDADKPAAATARATSSELASTP